MAALRDAAGDQRAVQRPVSGPRAVGADDVSRALAFLQATAPDEYPLLLHFPYFDLDRKQVIKQADLVLAMVMAGDRFTARDKARRRGPPTHGFFRRRDGGQPTNSGGRRRQRLQHPGRDGQRIGQSDRQPGPAAIDLPDGRARSRARTCSRRTSRACRPGSRSAPTSTATSAARRRVDFLVAMNPETAREDVSRSSPARHASTTSR